MEAKRGSREKNAPQLPRLPDIVFTKHARDRMEERGISPGDVLEALENPVQHYYDSHRDVYLLLGSNRVGVVYAYEAPRIVVVTVLRENEYRHLVRRLGSRRYRVVEE